ncbi:MAG: cobalamin biosynthesis protein CobD [Bacteroidales bacterium]|nr:cobalamin biosynthesis protein CobD [Bacteroidales bacterium]
MDERVILIILPLAYILDLLLGDPVCLPHPIVWFGKTISFAERKANKGYNKKLKGAIISFLLIVICFFFFFFVFHYIKIVNYLVFILISILFVFYGLANKTLILEGKMVFKALYDGGLKAGRKQLRRIVGRNTDNLDENQIKIAVLETLSENLSDGVVAPLFYFAIGGVPAMMAYKMINTLDSMIGYKTDRYKQFGWFAAKIDDIVNYIPARITALFIAVLSGNLRSFKFILKFGDAHSSPNAGYPEAALAGALDCQFGGNMHYGDYISEKPVMGFNKRDITLKDLKQTIIINHLVCFISVVTISIIKWLII